MQSSGTLSFFQYLAGFLLLITLSFGITFAVSKYTTEKEAQQAASAARAVMLQQ